MTIEFISLHRLTWPSGLEALNFMSSNHQLLYQSFRASRWLPAAPIHRPRVRKLPFTSISPPRDSLNGFLPFLFCQRQLRFPLVICLANVTVLQLIRHQGSQSWLCDSVATAWNWRQNWFKILQSFWALQIWNRRLIFLRT